MWFVEELGSIAVLTFAGYRTMCDSCDSCNARWAAELVERCRPLSAAVLVVDLTQADYLAGEILDGVIRVNRAALERGAECRVCGADGVRVMFAATKSDRILQVFASTENAVAGVKCLSPRTEPPAG